MREPGSPVAAKSRKTTPKPLKERSQEGKSLKGLSFLPIQFLPEALKGEDKKRETERKKSERDAVSEDETWIWSFLSLHLTSKSHSLNVC